MSFIRSIAVVIGIGCFAGSMAPAADKRPRKQSAENRRERIDPIRLTESLPPEVARAVAVDGWERVATVARWLPTASNAEVRALYLTLADRRELKSIDWSLGSSEAWSVTFIDIDLLRSLVLMRWCELNPAEAIAGSKWTRHQGACWEAWSMVDPDAALAQANAHPESPLSAYRYVFPTLGRMDPERVQPLLDSDDLHTYKGHSWETLEAVCQGLAREDFRAAGLLALEWDQPVKTRLIREFARRDLAGALAWAQGLEPIDFSSTALSEVLAVWSRRNPEQVTEFIESLPPSRRKFRFWAEQAERLALENINWAAAWADRAQHPIPRHLSLAAAAQVAARDNPAEALALLLGIDRNEPDPYFPTRHKSQSRLLPWASLPMGFEEARGTAARWYPLDCERVLPIDAPPEPRVRRPGSEDPDCPPSVYTDAATPGLSQLPPIPILDAVPLQLIRASALLQALGGASWTELPRPPAKQGFRLAASKPVIPPRREWIEEMKAAPSATARARVVIALAERVPPEDLPALADWVFVLPEPIIARLLHRATLHRWLKEEPMAALTWVLDTDPAGLAAAVEAWTTHDPMAAVAWFESTMLPKSAEGVPMALAKGLAPVDPARAFRILRGWELSNPAEIDEITEAKRNGGGRWEDPDPLVLRLAFESIAKSNPLKLYEESSVLGSNLQFVARTAAITLWADRDAAQAVALAGVQSDRNASLPAVFWGDLTSGQKLERLLTLPELVAEFTQSKEYLWFWLWSSRGGWQLLPHLHRQANIPKPLRSLLLRNMGRYYAEWFIGDPLEALVAMDSVASDRREDWLFQDNWGGSLLGICARENPDATAQWTRTHLKGTERSEVLSYIDEIRKQDTPRPQTAKTPPPPDPTSVVDEEAAGWVRQFEHAWARLDKLSPEERRSLVALASSRLVADRLSSDSKADGSRRQFLWIMADRSPAETAMGLAPDLPDDEFMMKLCINIAVHWASEFPREAADWAASLPSETFVKSWAIRNAVSVWRCLDIEAAEQWLAQHPDPEVRESVPTLRR